MIDSANMVVNQPLPVVEAMVRDVSSWATLFGDVEDVIRLARDRYVVQLRQGRAVHPALLRVCRQTAEHRVSWRTLSGPVWSGELHLLPLAGGRTAVHLSFDRTRCGASLRSGPLERSPERSLERSPERLLGWLRGLLAGFGRAARGWLVAGQAARDLRRLRERADALPRPVRPHRMGPLPGARPVEDVLIIEGMNRRPEAAAAEETELGESPRTP